MSKPLANRTVAIHAIHASRKADDLPAFCGEMVEEFAEGRHPPQG